MIESTFLKRNVFRKKEPEALDANKILAELDQIISNRESNRDKIIDGNFVEFDDRLKVLEAKTVLSNVPNELKPELLKKMEAYHSSQVSRSNAAMSHSIGNSAEIMKLKDLLIFVSIGFSLLLFAILYYAVHHH